MSFPYPYPGPIAPFNNLPVNAQYYVPQVFDISAITYGATTVVTTSVNHDYVIGQIVRLIIPSAYGATQINGQEANVIAIPAANQVTLNLNTSQGITVFNGSATDIFQKPQIAAIGDVNSGQINMGRTNNLTYVPGSFINISPI